MADAANPYPSPNNQQLYDAVVLIDPTTGLAYSASGGGGGGGAVTIADGANVVEGATTDAAATAGGTGTISAKLRRISTQLPAALGSAAAASSLATTASTEDVARTGIVTETAPASDTASSGLNGRLQRIAQRLTSLIALFPTALGSAAAASSLAVTASTEDVARQGIITETAPASDTASSGQNGRLQRIAQRLTSLIALLPASLGAKAGSASLSVVPASDATYTLASTGYTSAIGVTRPANTTAYTAGDVVGGAITFTNAGASGGPVICTSAALRYDVTAIPSGMTSFRLHLYDATPPSAYADNAAWDLPGGDRANYLGYIDLGSPADLGSTLYTQVDGVQKQLKLNASTSLFGYLVTAGGYTPAANSETLQVTLRNVGV